MSRKHKKKFNQTQVEAPEVDHSKGRSIIASSLGESLGVEMTTTNELMNWIITGNPKGGYFRKDDNDTF